MIRSLKALGLFVAAMCVLAALLASTASAEETVSAYFISGVGAGETAKVDGTSTEANTFSIGGLSVTCETTKFTGQAVSAGELSTEAKLEPTYEGCHVVVAGITKLATITTNGCKYVANATATFKEEGRSEEISLKFSKIECPEGKQIETHVYKSSSSEAETLCTYDIKAQESLSGTTITNEEGASPPDILADINVSGIAATNTKTSVLCGTNESVTVTYKGQVRFNATSAESKTVSLQAGAPKRFRLNIEPAVATGEKGTAEIVTEKGTIKCTNVHYVGTTNKKLEKDLTITPKYEACKAFGLDADVNFEGCTYTFTLIAGIFGDGKEPGGTPKGETHTKGPMHIVCPTGKSIKVQPTEGGNVKCTITIGEQSPEGVVDLKNELGGKASEDYVLFTHTVTALIYEVDKEPNTCGDDTIAHADGKLEGAIKVKGFEDKGGTPPKTGTQVNFRISGTAAP